MSNKRKWVIVIVIASAAVLALMGAGAKGRAVVPVRTSPATKGSIVSKIFTTGVIKASENVRISSRSGGKLVLLAVKEGDTVKKGALIAKIDDTELFAQFKQSEASFDQASVDLDSSQKNFDRMASLYKDKAITEQQMEAARAQLKVSQARLKQIQGQIDLIKNQIDNTVISSPISGIVSQKFISEGEIASPGSPVAAVYNPSSLYDEANVDEADIGKVAIGQASRIKLDAYPGQAVSGAVSYIASASQDIKEKGVTFIVKVAVTRSPVILRMGMTSDVDITTGTKDNVIKVPAIAIIEKDGKKFVYTVENNRAKAREVTTGLESDEESEITSGVKEGQEIIISGLDKLSDKKQVRIQQGGTQK